MRTIKLHKRQMGHGLGGIFRSLSRMFMPVARTVFNASKPLLKSTAKTIGKTALQAGADTVLDVVNGADLKESMSKNLKQGTKRVVNETKQAIKGSNKRKNTQLNQPSRSKTSKKKNNKKLKTIFD